MLYLVKISILGALTVGFLVTLRHGSRLYGLGIVVAVAGIFLGLGFPTKEESFITAGQFRQCREIVMQPHDDIKAYLLRIFPITRVEISSTFINSYDYVHTYVITDSMVSCISFQLHLGFMSKNY